MRKPITFSEFQNSVIERLSLDRTPEVVFKILSEEDGFAEDYEAYYCGFKSRWKYDNCPSDQDYLNLALDGISEYVKANYD